MGEYPPAVREALDRLRPVPKPDPSTWDAARRVFLSQARELSQPSAASEPRRTSAGTLPEVGRRALWTVARLLIVLGLVLGAGAGVVSAAQASRPGSVLYPVKLMWEDVQLALISDPQVLTERAMAMAQTRVDEAEESIVAGEPVPQQVIERYQQQVDLALRASGTLTDPLQLRAQDVISRQLAAHVQAMTEATRSLQQGPDQGDTGVRQMLQVMEQVRSRIPAQRPTEDDVVPPDDDSERGPHWPDGRSEDAGSEQGQHRPDNRTEDAGPGRRPGRGEDARPDEIPAPPADRERRGPPDRLPVPPHVPVNPAVPIQPGGPPGLPRP